MPNLNIGIFETHKDIAIYLYPNPARDYVLVSGTAVIRQVNLFDISGRLVSTTVATGSQAKVSTVGLPKGIYIVRTQLADGTIVTKRLTCNKGFTHLLRPRR